MDIFKTVPRNVFRTNCVSRISQRRFRTISERLFTNVTVFFVFSSVRSARSWNFEFFKINGPPWLSSKIKLQNWHWISFGLKYLCTCRFQTSKFVVNFIKHQDLFCSIRVLTSFFWIGKIFAKSRTFKDHRCGPDNKNKQFNIISLREPRRVKPYCCYMKRSWF